MSIRVCFVVFVAYSNTGTVATTVVTGKVRVRIPHQISSFSKKMVNISIPPKNGKHGQKLERIRSGTRTEISSPVRGVAEGGGRWGRPPPPEILGPKKVHKGGPL